jgi:hypothetical protein
MNIISFDNIIKDPKEYVKEIIKYGFQDIADGENVFKNIQPRDSNDEFAQYVRDIFPDYKVTWNFVRKSPINQQEPNFIHSDDMMGDITVILYLNEEPPNEDGTTIYDDEHKVLCKFHSKFNRMMAFDAVAPHSRNIFENFGTDESSRLVQVIFLKQK